MARNGLKILDSDMHVFEPHDLYIKYMDPKWGERISFMAIGDLSAESRKKILWDNCARLYGIS